MSVTKVKTFFDIVSVLGLIVLAHTAGWLNDFDHGIRRFFFSFSRSLVHMSNVLTQPDEVQASLDRLQNLEKQVVAVAYDRVQFSLLEQENNQLREQLSFLQTHEYSTIGGDVVGNQIGTLDGTIFINRGEGDGIKVGQPVIVAGGVLIGKIIKIESNSAVIQLLTDSQSKVAATVMNEERSIGLVEGGYGLSIQMNFIPQNETVQVGDVIVSSGLEEAIPRGLLIGQVTTVEKEPYQPFQHALLTPFLPLQKLTVVSVIINAK